MQQNIAINLPDMWPESSSINVINLTTKINTIPQISNFSYGIFLAAVYLYS